MSPQPYLHIVSFDIPYPPDYGGVIDVFFKIKYLHQAGIRVVLHCFQYSNKKISEELEQYCSKVYYYKRYTGFWRHFSFLPYTVASRIHKDLLQNLQKDNYPVLFETLHSAYFIKHPTLKKRLKILRLSNIEHHYYYHLFLSEKNFIKKLYFLIESMKLYFYEKQAFSASDIILPVTSNDEKYVRRYYANIKTQCIPSFHSFQDNSVCKGKGEYLLYHGNLSVPENYTAAQYLLETIAPHISMPVIIAGKNPPAFLYRRANKLPHIKLITNPDAEEMKQLIQNAHIVWLYTRQPTGLKLKLIYSLYAARFVLCNAKIIAGTSLKSNASFYIKNTAPEMIETIAYLQNKEFGDVEYSARQSLLQEFDNKVHLKKLLDLL